MKIAYDHIIKYFDDKPDINDLSSKLFQLGHEHEIHNSIFDIEFTPNRGDCLSLLGLVRDLNVFYETNFSLSTYDDDLPILELNFENKIEEECPKISFLNIEIEGDIPAYKDYLEDYFTKFKINKNNFFTDISNYIAYEMGQPTHCYDNLKLGKEITLEENFNEENFVTLLNENIKLTGKDIVFKTNEKIINLAGVMGGLETACEKDTKNVLIECAYFKPDSIINKAVKYNLYSESSYKFERGVDPECHDKVLRRFIKIVSEHVKITKLGIYSFCNISKAPHDIEIEYRPEKISSILGITVDESKYKESLEKLGFEVNSSIKVPLFRNDIKHQNDLAEEFARIYGYDKIPIRPINLEFQPCKLEENNENKIKSFLLDNGFDEVINSPFCSFNNKNAIKVDNPLDSNRAYIRTNITNSLIENVIYNEKRQMDSIKLFEISDIYSKNNSLNKEKKIGIIVSGRQGHNYKEFQKKLDQIYLIDIFDNLCIDVRSTIIKVDRSKFKSKINTPIYALEFSLNSIDNNISYRNYNNKTFNDFVKYQPISEFPSSFRDLSFSIKDGNKITEVVNLLSNYESSIIKDSFIFDLYKNVNAKETKLGYRYVFQSYEKTLTDDDINNEIKLIVESVLKIDSVLLPGY